MKKFFSLLFAVFAVCFCMNLKTERALAQSSDVEIAQTETNAFRIVRTVDEKISLSYIFPFNSAVFRECGFDEKEISVFRFYLSIFVGTLASQNRDRASDGVFVGQVTMFSDVDGVGFSIVFDDLTAQQTFFSAGESSSSSNISSSGFFMTKTEVFIDFPINSTSAENLKSVFSLAVTAWAQNEKIDDFTAVLACLDESIFVYEFATSSSSLKSDSMALSNGLTHHYFLRNSSNLSDQISFYVTTPNVPIWYLSALILTLAGMALAYFFLSKRFH